MSVNLHHFRRKPLFSLEQILLFGPCIMKYLDNFSTARLKRTFPTDAHSRTVTVSLAVQLTADCLQYPSRFRKLLSSYSQFVKHSLGRGFRWSCWSGFNLGSNVPQASLICKHGFCKVQKNRPGLYVQEVILICLLFLLHW